MSGKRKLNTEKATMISDGQGRELWLGAIRPGRMHHATAVRTEGTEELLRLRPNVKAEVDSGYVGLARDFPGQVSAPPKKPAAGAGPSQRNFHDHARRRQSQRRTMVEHANAEVNNGGPCNAGPASATTCPRSSPQSAPWSPTAAPSAQLAGGRARSSSSSARRPADPPRAEPPAQHVPSPIVRLLVSPSGPLAPLPSADGRSARTSRVPGARPPIQASRRRRAGERRQ